MSRGCLVALFVAGGLLLLFVLGAGAFMAEECHVDEVPVARAELPAARQEALPRGADNVWSAWYYCGQVSDKYLRYDIREDGGDDIEKWILGYDGDVRELKRVEVVGELPEWQIRNVPPPEWWQVPADAHGVMYRFFSGRNYVTALVLPTERRVWVAYFKV